MKDSNVLKNKNFYVKLSLARLEIMKENSKSIQKNHLRLN
jgi:hypothetical protein